jgi:hypothetical protein
MKLQGGRIKVPVGLGGTGAAGVAGLGDEQAGVTWARLRLKFG